MLNESLNTDSILGMVGTGTVAYQRRPGFELPAY
jgi:hypothetical protein